MHIIPEEFVCAILVHSVLGFSQQKTVIRKVWDNSVCWIYA